jgi:hypothetical protein
MPHPENAHDARFPDSNLHAMCGCGWAVQEMVMKFEYKEYAGVKHGPLIEAAMPDIFAFVAGQSRPAAR